METVISRTEIPTAVVAGSLFKKLFFCLIIAMGVLMGVSMTQAGVAAEDKIFVTYNDGTLRQFDSAGTPTIFATGLSTPKGLAVKADFLYVANTGANRILKYFVGGGTATTFASAGLSSPHGLAFNSGGDLYATNYTDSTVQRFDGASGAAVPPFPVTSTNMNGPYGVAFDAAGNIYAASHNNNTIQKFTAAGVFVSDFVSFAGGLGAPRGVAIRAGVLYVANYSGSTITMFDIATGNNLGNYATAADGLLNPVGIVFNAAGHLYVTNAGNQNILKFTAAHTGTLFSNIFNQSPDFIAIHSQPTVDRKIFVSYNNGIIRKFDAAGNPTTFATGLSTPKGLAIKANFLYAANTGANAILKYPTGGGSATPFPSTGLSGPYGIAFDSTGDLYAANYTDSTIQRLNGGTGAAVAPFPVTGDNMNGPFGMAFDADGNIYAASHNNNTIQKFTAAGVFVSDFVSFAGGLSAPRGLAIHAGVLYVANYITSKITMFDIATGNNLGDYATSADGLLNPVGIAIDTDGTLYVANAGNQNILVFTAAHTGTLFSNIYNQSPDFIAIHSAPVTSIVTLVMAQAAKAVDETDGSVVLSVNRTGPTASAVGVSFTTSSVGGTASLQDYTATTGTLDFAPGETTKTITVPIQDDELVEKSETFTVTLSAASGGAVLGSPASTKVTIVDASALDDDIDTKAPGKPVVTYPKANATIGVDSGSAITVLGTAADDKAVKMVEVRFNTAGGSTDFVPAALSAFGQSVTFTASVIPETGTNTMEVRTTDFAGHSTSMLRTFKVLRPLLINGDTDKGSLNLGNVGIGTTMPYCEVGKSYTLVAKAKTGFIFDRWGVEYVSALTPKPAKMEIITLVFNFEEGLVISAFFIANPFTAVAGSYNGLVTASLMEPTVAGTVPSVSTEGCFTAKMETTGTFTGKLTLDGAVLPLVGVFDNAGRARFGANRALTVNVVRRDRPNISLVVDLERRTSVLGGGLGDYGLKGSVKQFHRAILIAVSDINADRACYDGKTPGTTVPDEYLTVSGASGAIKSDGIFTCVISTKALAQQHPAFSSESEYPQGFGCATVKVGKGGGVNFACTLADGTPVTASSMVCNSGPPSIGAGFSLFAPLYNNRGCVRAYVSLDASNPESDMSSANMLWCRPVQDTQHYPYGFDEGLNVELRAAKYVMTAGQSVLKAPDDDDADHLGETLAAADANGNAAFSFFDVFTELAVSRPVNLSVTDAAIYISTAGGGVWKMKVTRSTGIIDGTLTLSDDSTPKFRGIIYQKGTGAGAHGFYLTTRLSVDFDYQGQSGGVSLIAAP